MKFILSQKGKPALLHAGYRYNLSVKNKSGTTNWRCFRQRECNASILLDSHKQILRDANHRCSPDNIRNLIDGCMDDCKKDLRVNFKSVQNVFEHRFLDGNKFKNLEHVIPEFRSEKDTLYRARNKYLNVVRSSSANSKDVRLPQHIVNDFFLYDDYDIDTDDRILIFGTLMTKELREFLMSVDTIFGDGTFKVSPKPFYQLYTFHVDLARSDDTISFVPLIYALLPNKSQRTYERLFSILKIQFGMELSVYKCDYEVAVIQAMKEVYPNVKIKGCYYHFWKAVERMSDKLNFSESQEGREITHLCSQLALLPPVIIPEAYLAISEIAPKNEITTKFLSYFNSQWIQKITNEVFSCYGEKNRTTNAVEGWHRRINALIPPNPSLFQFIQKMKSEAQKNRIKIRRNALYCPDKKRRAKDMAKDKKIQNIISDCMSNKITVTGCINLLATITRF